MRMEVILTLYLTVQLLFLTVLTFLYLRYVGVILKFVDVLRSSIVCDRVKLYTIAVFMCKRPSGISVIMWIVLYDRCDHV